MIGLSGLLFTSASGAKTQLMPSARASFAVKAPSKRVSSRSRAAANAMLRGPGVDRLAVTRHHHELRHLIAQGHGAHPRLDHRADFSLGGLGRFYCDPF